MSSTTTRSSRRNGSASRYTWIRELLGHFLAATGIGPAEIRAAAQEPGFLIGVLDYLAADERLLSAFAAEAEVDPSDIGKALAALGGHWEREIT